MELDPNDYLDPEAKARMLIDRQLRGCGWAVQNYRQVNFGAARGVAVREFPGLTGPADYLLFVDRVAVGVVEAKPVGTTLTGVEPQSGRYLGGLPSWVRTVVRPLPFAYESTGEETRFTNRFDPDAASREVFTFHRPETLADWCERYTKGGGAVRASLRGRLRQLPPLDPAGLWSAQATAIGHLERSLAHGRPRALIQMATGSGKTFTAANVSYRLIKHADARRILFLVDRATLGSQTLAEFQSFTTPDDGRKFTELYNVQHLTSNAVDSVARVTISTIQRLYSILRGEPELDAELDESPSYELAPSAPVEVGYNPRLPIEFFDVIVVDECHRSIYGVWRQVLDYFDAFVVGLTATPSKQTLGFFNQNLVMEYNHEQAVADRVNVTFDVYRISTRISERGSTIDAGLVTRFRDRQSRRVRLEQLDQDIDYDAHQLDRRVVARDQIRTIIRTFREKLPEIFPDRTHVPKTLIFAKDDSHADDIVQTVREEFGKGNDFAVKITYKSGSKAEREQQIQEFRNSYNPRIAVTVDLIATGTDVKPLECVFFMRMVRSRNFFEQMKGRGVRVIQANDLRGVTPDARLKDRFVIVDASGVTDHGLHDTLPLERLQGRSLESLLTRLSYGDLDRDLVSSVASRLARLSHRITKPDRAELETLAGMRLEDLTRNIVDALNPDLQLAEAQTATGKDDPTPEQVKQAADRKIEAAVRPLTDNPELRARLLEVRRSYEQAIDETSADAVTRAEFSADAADRARHTIESFRQFIEAHKDEITALQILYSQPWRRRLIFADVRELAQAISRPPYRWTPEELWQAYETLDSSKVHGSDGTVLTNLVALVRHALGADDELVAYPLQVQARFDAWLHQQRQAGRELTAEQLAWLTRIRDHVAASLSISPDDFDYTPFVERGGLGRAYEVFGDGLNELLEELNEVLAA